MNVSEETSARGRKRRSRVSRVRKMVLAGAFVLFCIGVVAVGGMGDACSVGYEAIAMVCPLGALEGFFGSWSFVPRMARGLVLALAVVLIAGRAFCSWICPVPPLQGFLRTKKQRQRDAVERKAQAEDSLALWKSSCSGCKGDSCGDACAQASGADGRGSSAQPLSARGNVGLDSRHAVLAGTLATTALCGFPVFCLLCPVGLTFATVIALYRFIGFNEPTIDLLVFPAIIVLELVLLRKWCHRFCPISALMSLLAPLARRLRPQVSMEACLRSKGEDCTVCGSVCPEGIDPVADLGRRSLSECTRCGRCAEACPAQAIAFRKTRVRATDPVVIDEEQAVLVD